MRGWACGIAAAAMLTAFAAGAQAGTVDRLYVIDCGHAHAADQSLWSPGVNVGVPIDFADNCYLIHHSSAGYVLWDTGLTDRAVALPDGIKIPALGYTWYRDKALPAELAAIGVAPGEVHYVVLSHVHPDHAGNVDEFPDATLVMQQAEWDYAMTLPQKPFDMNRKKKQLLAGDKDLFGDGSLVVLSTRGHTPGHESLLVHLPKTGYVVLAGDVAHFEANWDNRRVPGFNADKAASLASMEKVARIVKEKHAQLWLNHDKPSSDARRHAPRFYD